MTYPVIWATALGIMLICFAGFTVASYRHFGQARSWGNLLVRVLTLAATAICAGLAPLVAPPSATVALSGAAMGLLSLGVFALALRATTQAGLHVAFTDSGPDNLVTGGIYRFARNPFYLSYLLYWGAWTVLLQGHWAALVILTAFFAIYWLAISREEAYLSRQFGDAFAAYRAATGRFLPKLRFGGPKSG